MAIIKAKGQQTSSVSVGSEGADVYVRAMRDGSLINMPWLTAKAIEGKVFAANTGLLTTPDTFNATIADAEQDMLVNVPTGTTIIPVYLQVNLEDTGTVLAVDVVAVASNVYDNTGLTSTVLTVMNMRTDKAAGGSQCTAHAVVTANATAVETGNYVEFWRPMAGLAEDAFAGNTMPTNNQVSHSRWSIGDAVVPPVIVGPGSLSIFTGAQAGIGFITAIWVEEPTADLT